MKITLSIILFFITILSLNAQNLMLKLNKKVESKRIDQLFIKNNSNLWLANGYGNFFLWKKFKLKETFSIPHYIKGELLWNSKERKINGGYFEYALDTKEYTSFHVVKDIMDKVDVSLDQNGLTYEIENSKFELSSNRLVIALHYRPSRKDQDISIDAPKNILSLVDLNTKKTIKILDSKVFSSYQNFILTPKYICGFSSHLTIWDIQNGEQVIKLTFQQKDISHLSCIEGRDAFLFVLRNGKVFEYDIPTATQTELTQKGFIVNKAFAFKFNDEHLYFFFSEKNEKGILYQYQKSELKDIGEISLTGTLTDFHFNPLQQQLWLSTFNNQFSILTYKLCKKNNRN